jgi:hypothetical protein
MYPAALLLSARLQVYTGLDPAHPCTTLTQLVPYRRSGDEHIANSALKNKLSLMQAFKESILQDNANFCTKK